MEVTWNPWHGCTKYSEGCRHCYVYRQDEMFGRDSRECRKTNDFNLPIKTALISTLKNYQDKLYDIYITEKMSFKSGSRYILSIL